MPANAVDLYDGHQMVMVVVLCVLLNVVVFLSLLVTGRSSGLSECLHIVPEVFQTAEKDGQVYIWLVSNKY